MRICKYCGIAIIFEDGYWSHVKRDKGAYGAYYFCWGRKLKNAKAVIPATIKDYLKCCIK
jgi:hypothetical protein